MSLVKFLSSRVFLKQIIIAFVIVFVAIFLLLKWLNITTDHGHEITVPDLKKLTISQSEEELKKLDLDYVVLDSVDFIPTFPKGGVVEQDPIAGAKVKEGRKIYLKVNSSGYAKVILPDLVQKTYRQVLPTLHGLGLDEGKISYVPNIAKDMVLELRYKGKVLKAGDVVLKTSKIDLVLGDGNIGFTDTDSIEIIDGE